MPKVTSHKLLEVACFDTASCFIAEQAGADRVEFCSDYNSGGVTPLWEDIVKAKEGLKIPLHVIIRPRGGNFVYDTDEIDTMKRAILFCKEQQVDGVVFGVLNPDSTINKKTTKELVDIAKPMSLTFHRAIDACADREQGIRELISMGFHRVLTSGGKASAIEGLPVLQQLEKHYGDQIIILPGGGIRSHTISQLSMSTGCREFHTAAVDPLYHRLDTEELKAIIKRLNP